MAPFLSFALVITLVSALPNVVTATKLVLTNDDGWAAANIRAHYAQLAAAGHNVRASRFYFQWNVTDQWTCYNLSGCAICSRRKWIWHWFAGCPPDYGVIWMRIRFMPSSITPNWLKCIRS